MKKSMMKLAQSFFIALACLLLWGSVSADNGKIGLKVTGAGADTKLEIESNDVKCGNDKHCIQTNKGNYLDLDFDLDNACNNNGPAYRLSEMTFSMIQREPEAPGSKVMVKAFGKYVMPAIVMSDFDTNPNGIVRWTQPNQLMDHKIKLRNKNHGQYVVFYQIRASKCPGSNVNGPEHIYLDPRVRNTGN